MLQEPRLVKIFRAISLVVVSEGLIKLKLINGFHAGMAS